MNLTNYEKAIKELIFLKNNINFFSKKPLRVYDLPRIVIFSDASSFTTRAIFENESGIIHLSQKSNNERTLGVINLERIMSDRICVKNLLHLYYKTLQCI